MPLDARLHRLRRAALAWLLAALAACGGGGGGGGEPPPAPPIVPPAGSGDEPYDDPQAYSSLRDGALAGATEAAAVTRREITLGGNRIAYTARAGHLIARAPGSGAAQASMFHVAYTADGANAATRPVTFFYNGGPGSATVWLHLGSFGPRRIATGVPATNLPRPFAVVANDESLLDVSDLVFVDAVGAGLSTAITPYTNRSFWSVDADAALFRDFVVRWLQANGRTASPRFLYGESYGGVRTGVLARLLEQAGVTLDGVVLQSPAMDYNSNCDVVADVGAEVVGCAAYLASYALVGAFHGLVTPAGNADAYAAAMRGFALEGYAPAVATWLRGGGFDAALPPQLAAATGLAANWWVVQPNLLPGVFRTRLLSQQLVGRYDGRVVAARGSALAAEGDPSSTLISGSFAAAIASELRDTLRYRNASTYVLLSQAIESWDFRHGGRAWPDSIPDLAEALRLNPRLRVLAANGYHDLATPFHLTELDLARIVAPGRIAVRNYPGGHMSYLDDATRVRQKADLRVFYAEALAARAAAAAAAPDDARRRALAWRGAWAERPARDRAGVPPTSPQTPLPQAAFQVERREPWVPPAQRPR